MNTAQRVLERLESWASSVRRTDDWERPPVTSHSSEARRRAPEPRRDASGVAGSSRVLSGLDPAELAAPSDVPELLGMTPAEFVTGLVAENDGHLRRRRIREYTAWPEPTIGLVLRELAEKGAVVLVHIGDREIVFLPETAPDGDPFDHIRGPSRAGPSRLG